MSQVKLEPGWLDRDISQATERTSAWNKQKVKQPTSEPSNRTQPQAPPVEAGQSPKD